VITAARLEDAEGVFEVQRATWLATYCKPEMGLTEEVLRRRLDGEDGCRQAERIEGWRSAIADPARAVLVVRAGQAVVGFTAPGSWDARRRVGALYVLPPWHGVGLGGLLLEAALDWHGGAGPVFANVASFNERAIRFYRRHGFRATGAAVIDHGATAGEVPIPLIEMSL